MSTKDEIGTFPPILAGERKTLTFQVDDELPVGVTLVGPPVVTVTVTREDAQNPSAFVVSSGFDAAARNILVVVEGTVRPAEYEIRVGCGSTDANHKPGRAGRIAVI